MQSVCSCVCACITYCIPGVQCIARPCKLPRPIGGGGAGEAVQGGLLEPCRRFYTPPSYTFSALFVCKKSTKPRCNWESPLSKWRDKLICSPALNCLFLFLFPLSAVSLTNYTHMEYIVINEWINVEKGESLHVPTIQTFFFPTTVTYSHRISQ